MSDAPDIDGQKAQARVNARRARQLAHAACPDAALRLLDTFPVSLARASPIAGYWPVGTEIDPRVLLGALAKAGAKIALPHMTTKAGPARFLAWEAGAPLKADAFGVPSPPASAPAVHPRLILTPLLAFDRSGARLGQGGGHYDRILARLRLMGALAVGLAFSAQEMPTTPTGPFDERLDWVVTEREAIACRTR